MRDFAERARIHFTTATLAADDRTFAEDATVMAVACASLAEDALRKATRSDRPPIECWGCCEHPDPKVKADRFHRYFDCPRKLSDPHVREAGELRLKEFMEERRARRQQQRGQRGQQYYGRPPPSAYAAMSNDDAVEAGHHSADAATLVATIAAPETIPSVRAACYSSLREKLQAKTPPSAIVATATKRKSDDKDENPKPPPQPFQPQPFVPGGGGYYFHFMPVGEQDQMASVMKAIATRHSVNLEITQVLPHIRLPIGSDGKSSILSMVDSGAGLSLGRLQYHRSIFEKCPELVAQFVYLKDADNMNEFGLGQIGEGDGPKVTAVIAYKTPFMINAQPVTVSIGLSDSVTANTIIGLPFLKAADAVAMFGSNALLLQRVGVTLNIEYQVPLRADQAPQTTPECQAFGFAIDLATHTSLEQLKSNLAVAATNANNPGLDAFTPHSDQE